MARIPKERLEEISTWYKNPEQEQRFTKEESRDIVEDLEDARAESEHLRKALQQCNEELKHFEEIIGSVRRNIGRAALHHKCQAPGCEDYAEPGSKICNKHVYEVEDGLLGDLCTVRGCRQERSSPWSRDCVDHHWDAKHIERGANEDFMAVLSRGEPVIYQPSSPHDRQFRIDAENADYMIRLVAAGSVNEHAPLSRVIGPPEPIPGLGLEITTHGLPAAIDPEPVGEELTRATSDLHQGENLSPVCVYGQCSNTRVAGHAFCEEHLQGL
jgi:hypothetical protein